MTEVTTGAQGAPGELKGALLGFVEELRGFRQDIEKKLTAQDERMSMFERKTAFRARSPLSTEAAPEVPHQKAFNAYLRNGDDTGLRGLSVEEKGLTAASDGGFLAAPAVSETVQDVLSGSVSLRALANVVTVEAASYDVLVDRDEMVTGWASENDAAETAASTVERVTVPLHELSAMPKASQRLLDDAAFDVETWLAGRIAQKFIRAETYAFLHGSGMDQPLGLLKGAFDSSGIGGIGTIGEIKTGAAGGFVPGKGAETLIDLVYALPAAYRANAAFVMSSKTAAAIRKLKDADGRFIWADSLSAGEPARLLGYPVMSVEEMPEIADGSRSILFGDFRTAYTIAERPELRVLRDPFSAKPHVLFYASKRVGGGLVDGRAMKALKFGA
ncbi:phage major capsid protein [Paracoccus aerodenitrificans]|uniref:phage major capsid protein n=1 Tax=Paracoccus aerodenitrificans TaxID=3017781 RepID=UPI0022F01290|nr:phage major capsid protein [Paracoccus aerodenitrificans]WBU65337.1 phage major capsid protein [Paracoccus aerodenitrificans]